MKKRDMQHAAYEEQSALNTAYWRFRALASAHIAAAFVSHGKQREYHKTKAEDYILHSKLLRETTELLIGESKVIPFRVSTPTPRRKVQRIA